MAVTHRSISVAPETSFGSLNATTNLPSTSGLTFISIPCERDPIIIYGEPVASERNDARDGSYGLPPEPDTVYSSGSRVRRRTGQVQIRLDLTTIGATPANYDSNYLGYLLGAGFQTAKHTMTSDSPSAVASVNSFTPTLASTQYAVGALVGIEKNGIAEYSAVTDNDDSGDVSISPAFSALTTSDTIRALQTWYPGSRSQTGNKVSSIAFEVNGVDFKSMCFGCVLESISISLDSGRVMADMTFQSACIQDDHASAVSPVEPSYNAGSPPFFRGSYVVVSTGSPTSLTNASSTGDELARTKLDCEDFTLTITNTLTLDHVLALKAACKAKFGAGLFLGIVYRPILGEPRLEVFMMVTSLSARACSAAFLVSYTTAPPKLILNTIPSCLTSSLCGVGAVVGVPVGVAVGVAPPPPSARPFPDAPAITAAPANNAPALKEAAALGSPRANCAKPSAKDMIERTPACSARPKRI
jgi:hypothetical protein